MRAISALAPPRLLFWAFGCFMKRTPLLFLNVIIIATCGLIYELLAATVSSYVLGDSVTQ